MRRQPHELAQLAHTVFNGVKRKSTASGVYHNTSRWCDSSKERMSGALSAKVLWELARKARISCGNHPDNAEELRKHTS